MYTNDNDFIAKTISVKGYKKRKALSIKMLLIYFIYVIIIAIILVVTFLSLNGLV